jgi:adenosylcobyric acid synthase
MTNSRTATQAKAIALLGTGSDVGKSVLAAGLCRLLRRAGRAVAPFKGQNMSLNSFVTPEGGEIGRAQALQAEACGIPPHVDMNPILLKPESDLCSQVIVHGKVQRKSYAADYFRAGLPLFARVRESYSRLAHRYDVLVIEGAGSAAEMNLRDRDLVNWPVVALADARVLLVADIERGGVFAQLIGTLDLLREEERRRVIGVIINKFRGDARLFDDGVRFLEQRTGIPVLGIVPFLRDLRLDQEDALPPHQRETGPFTPQRVNIAVLLLPHMSNFTDFNALVNEPDVAVRYSESAAQLADADVDVVIIPGTKNTLADLRYLGEQDLIEAIRAHSRKGRELVGICGGYQMLGRHIDDPHEVEAGGGAAGLGLLEGYTVLQNEKTTTLVEGVALHKGLPSALCVRGYHIHMGETWADREPRCFELTPISGHRAGDPQGAAGLDRRFDGSAREDGLVWGTYIHGLFDEPAFRRAWLNRVRERKGLPPLNIAVSYGATMARLRELDRWAYHLQEHLTLAPVWAELQ